MTPSDPSRYHRQSIRLPGYDYAQSGAYFVTICTHDGACSFGEMVAGQVQLNDWGQVAAECWAAIPAHFGHVTLDEWVVMPNHVHGILMIMDAVGARMVGAQQCCAPTEPRPDTNLNVVPGSLGALLRSFKSAAAKRINLMRGATVPSVWQRNYCEHIIRNESELNTIRQYIRQNPVKWALDRDNLVNGRPEAPTADDYMREAGA